MDRLTSITNPMGEEEAIYTYNHAGEIISYRENKQMPESIYTYDYAGRLLSFRKPMKYFHDKAGRLIKELSKIGVDTHQEIRYTLDNVGRVIKFCKKYTYDYVDNVTNAIDG